MARVVFDGKYKVLLVPPGDITDRDAPTVAELEDSYVVDITTLCPKDFLDMGPQQGRVDGGDISTIFGAELMGTWRMQASSQHFLDDDPDDNVAYNEMDYGVLKDVVVIWSADADSPKDGDPAYVFPVEFGKHMPNSPAENERQRFTVEWALYEEPSLDAVVTGS